MARFFYVADAPEYVKRELLKDFKADKLNNFLILYQASKHKDSEGATLYNLAVFKQADFYTVKGEDALWSVKAFIEKQGDEFDIQALDCDEINEKMKERDK